MVRFPKLGALVLAGATAACTGNIANPGGEDPGSGGSGQSTTGSGGSKTNPGSGGAKTSGTGGSSSSGSGGSQGTPGSGGSDGSGSGGSDGMTTTPAQLDLRGTPLYLRFVRLTNEQWSNSVRDLLAISAPTDIAANFHATASGDQHDFGNNEAFLISTSPSGRTTSRRLRRWRRRSPRPTPCWPRFTPGPMPRASSRRSGGALTGVL